MKIIMQQYHRLGIFILLTVVAGSYSGLRAQTKKETRVQKTEEIKKMVSSRNFVFKAQFALPMGGSSFQLTSEYDVKVSKDTVISFLPYFGRAFTAPMNPSEGGIRFTSTDFQYNVSNKKKGGHDVVIKPKDAGSVQQLTFYISSSGYGSLQVTDNNRQPISFNGYFEKNQDKKQ